MSSITTELPPIVGEHIAAVNAFDTDRIVATFAPDAYVNDNRREIWGAEAIRKFMDTEIVGNQVTMEVGEVIDHYGDIIVRTRWDGTYDKTNLPDELVVTSYFATRDGKTHMHHVYAKLGTHRRGEAVERARALGLLAPSARRH